jgi:hypothetical protein
MNFTDVYLLNGSGAEVMHMSRVNSAGYPYILKAFTGLDVDGISARFYGKSTTGQNFYSMGLGKREIVLRVVINPDYSAGQTVDSLRSAVYKAIHSNRTALMTLRFDNNEYSQAVISGFVTKVEVGHFNSVPELQITLDCSRDPLLRSEAENVVSIFPNAPTIDVVDNESTAPHGFKMTLECSTNVSFIRFSDTTPDSWTFEVTPGTINGLVGFRVGDMLYFSSEDKNRYFYIVRNGDAYHLAHKIKALSIWPYMFPGETSFQMTSGFGLIELSYKNAYWGV